MKGYVGGAEDDEICFVELVIFCFCLVVGCFRKMCSMRVCVSPMNLTGVSGLIATGSTAVSVIGL